MVSKRWVAFIALIVLLSFIDTIGIVVTRVIPNKYSNILSEQCIPNWAIIEKIIIDVFNPYVKLVQYIGFLFLFVHQCKQ